MDAKLAQTIFASWQAYMETADRFQQMMITPPPSFLPYPVEILEQALNFVAKEHFDAGDLETATIIQRMMSTYLSGYYFGKGNDGKPQALDRPKTDEEALKDMRRTLDLILSDASLKTIVLEKLRASQQNWMALKRDQ